MNIIAGTLVAGAIIYSTERVVSAIEYHAQRTAAHPPTITGAGVDGAIAHIPDRTEFQQHVENSRLWSKGNRKQGQTGILHGYPLIETPQKKKDSSRKERSLSRASHALRAAARRAR